MCCEQHKKMGARQQNNTIYAVKVWNPSMQCVVQDMGAMDWCRSRYFKAHNTNGFFSSIGRKNAAQYEVVQNSAEMHCWVVIRCVIYSSLRCI